MHDAGFITRAQWLDARQQTPHLQSSRNLLVRLGFFALGCLLFGSIGSFISFFMFASGSFENYQIMLYINAIIGIVGAEYFTRRNFWGYGLEDAFILAIPGALAMGVGVATENLSLAVFVYTVVAVLCTVRYVHTISALLAGLGSAVFVGCLVFDAEIWDKAWLPILGFVLAILIYATQNLLRNRWFSHWYDNALTTVQVYAILLGYASVNYFVVRELSVALLDLQLGKADDIPLAPLFYFLTVAIPAALLYFALQKRSRLLLLCGLLTAVAAVASLRYYYYVLPGDVASILAGAALFGLALWGIKKLRGKESGLTYERDRYSANNHLLYAQAVLINAQLDLPQAVPNDSPMTFGGGGFSGGGAGESF